MDSNLKFRLEDYKKKLDRYTKTFMGLMKQGVDEWNSFAPSAADFVPPVPQVLRTKMADIGVEIPRTNKGDSLIKKILRWYLNSRLQPFSDRNYEFESVEDGIAFREEVFKVPPPNVIYKEMSSDKVMTQLAFAGMSCHYTRRIGKDEKLPHPKNAAFIHDVTLLENYKVRAPYDLYGAAAYFDQDHKICGIYCSFSKKLVSPSDGEEWDYAKWVWKTTFFLTVTYHDHLLISHLTEANVLLIATRMHLPCDHPLRVFMEPFIFHTDKVNSNAAASLTNKRGLVNRIWAFEFDEILRLTKYLQNAYQFRTLPEFIHPSMRDVKDEFFPMNHDANSYWKVVHDYVEGFINIHFPTDADLFLDLGVINFYQELCKRLKLGPANTRAHFLDVLTQLVCNGSGVHEHVGQISDYMLKPDFLGCKLQRGELVMNLQTYTQVLGLTVMTGLKMPWIEGNWGHLFSDIKSYKETMTCYQKFRQDLNDLRQEIAKRNTTTRHYPFHSFDPECLECSVSV